ncbi:MAG: hypothetical protein ACRDSH_10390 [Pseudonocardiaceae bacterium]
MAQVAELSKALHHLRLESNLVEHLRRQADEATAQVERILTSPMAQAGARIQRIMRLAEEEATERTAHAEAEATQLKADAEAEAAAKLARADQDMAELRARIEEQISGLRARAGREAKALLEHAKGQCDQLEADSAARRAADDAEAAQAVAQRESEASDRIRDSEVRSVARIHLLIQMMDKQLLTRVSAVERDESALRELRAQVADEVTAHQAMRAELLATLAGTHQLLAETLGQVRRVPHLHVPTERTDQTPADEAPAEPVVPENSEPPVPTQRSTERERAHLLNSGTEDRPSARGPR